MVIVREGIVTLQQALNEIADFPRGVIVKVQTNFTQAIFSSNYFNLDPETYKDPFIIADCNKQNFGGFTVDPKSIKKTEHYISGFKFTLTDGSIITVTKN